MTKVYCTFYRFPLGWGQEPVLFGFIFFFYLFIINFFGSDRFLFGQDGLVYVRVRFQNINEAKSK